MDTLVVTWDSHINMTHWRISVTESNYWDVDIRCFCYGLKKNRTEICLMAELIADKNNTILDTKAKDEEEVEEF